MNTATMLAATAVFGFTWGYQPLDERSTEYIIQLRHEPPRRRNADEINDRLSARRRQCIGNLVNTEFINLSVIGEDHQIIVR